VSLATKIGVALFLVLAAALGMTTVLNYLRFDQTLRTLITQRINVVSNETSQDLLAGIDLGLRLENMENLGAILDRRLGMSREVTHIAVQNCQGTIITQTAPDTATKTAQGAGTTEVPPDAQDKTSWTRFTDQGVIAVTPLRDSLGQCAGMLVITADSGEYFRKLDGAFTEMWKSAAIGMLAIIPVLGLLMVLMRRRHRVFSELHEDIERALAGQAGTSTAHDKDVLTESEMDLIALYREIRDQLPNDDPQTDRDTSVEKST
tara:strand:- start:903 stop:1688 length:786 start_codon:yes stop_codon:yes gene_type:complete